MRISDWSSDVCSSDLDPELRRSVLLVTGSTAVYERIALVNQHAGRVPVVSMLPDVVRPGQDSALLSIGVNQSSAVALAAVYAKDVLLGRAEQIGRAHV